MDSVEASTPFLSIPEVAALLGLSPGRTYGLASEGAIPIVRYGRRVRVPRAAFDEWLARQSETALATLRVSEAS